MKRFFTAIFVILMLCQGVGHSQTKTDTSNKPDTSSPMADQQHSADSPPNSKKQKPQVENEDIVGDHGASMIESIRKLANKTNLTLGLSILGIGIALGSWLASKSAAKSAKDTLTETRKSTRLEMQPYISCEYIQIIGKFIGDKHISLRGTAKIKNNGKIPANIRWGNNQSMASFGVYNWTKNSDPKFRQDLYLAPNSDGIINLVFDFKFPKDGEEELSLKSINLKGFIEIAYWDEFVSKGEENIAVFNFSIPVNPNIHKGKVSLNIEGSDPVRSETRIDWDELKDYTRYQ